MLKLHVLQQTNNEAQSVVLLHSNHPVGVRITVGLYRLLEKRNLKEQAAITVDGWPSAPSQTFVSRRMRKLEVSKELIWAEVTLLKRGLQETNGSERELAVCFVR